MNICCKFEQKKIQSHTWKRINTTQASAFLPCCDKVPRANKGTLYMNFAWKIPRRENLTRKFKCRNSKAIMQVIRRNVLGNIYKGGGVRLLLLLLAGLLGKVPYTRGVVSMFPIFMCSWRKLKKKNKFYFQFDSQPPIFFTTLMPTSSTSLKFIPLPCITKCMCPQWIKSFLQ